MGPTERMRVLVVDDEPTICRALSIALTRAGFEVVAVEQGEHALNLLQSEHFDCMIADLRIPDLRGDVLFELAAANQPQLKSRTLFTTGDVSEKASELIEACNCPVLPKPFDLNELIDTIRKMTRKVGEVSA
ncbi:MAG TPA: response regulator [Gemmatimonadaceae bacterium]|nr:response regulator [Gemmatimonadaceae bacterium]